MSCSTESVAKEFKDILYTLPGTVWKKEYHHKVRLPHDEGQKDLLTGMPSSFDGIHFRYRQRRIRVHERAETVDRTAFAILIFQLRCDFLRVSDAGV